MRHAITGRKFNRKNSHRKSLLSNLAKDLIKYEQIKTTLPKAKDLRPYVEKIITIGKKNTLHARRQLIGKFSDNHLVEKILNVLGMRYAKRNGGYLRIIKAGYRKGDMAQMAFIEFVNRDITAKPVFIPNKDEKENSEKTTADKLGIVS